MRKFKTGDLVLCTGDWKGHRGIVRSDDAQSNMYMNGASDDPYVDVWLWRVGYDPDVLSSTLVLETPGTCAFCGSSGAEQERFNKPPLCAACKGGQ